MNEITEPLRLAVGSHKAGSGKGCAMNVISWENGDTEITDYPACSARPLAKLVQGVNDTICVMHPESGFLCPECALTVLELGHATTGTAGETREQRAAWAAELMNSPEWGVTRLLPSGTGKGVVEAVAALLKRRADGDEPAQAEWKSANAAAGVSVVAQYASVAYSGTAYSAYAAQAASATSISGAYGFCDTAYGFCDTAYYAAAAAANAAGPYATAVYARARVEHCRSAIAAWHRICGTAPVVPEPAVTEQALRAMSAK